VQRTTTSGHAPGHHPVAAGGSARGFQMTPGAGSAARSRAMTLVQYLDVVLVVIAAVPALALGAPVFGYLIGAGAWILQRVIAHADRRWITRTREPRAQLGFNLFEAFGRIWLLAGAIVLAGVVGGRPDGLTAALLIFAAYSVAFVIRVLSGKPTPPRKSAP
jgi:hypothetical protein